MCKMALQMSLLVVILLGIFHSTRAAPPGEICLYQCQLNIEFHELTKMSVVQSNVCTAIAWRPLNRFHVVS
jgi:hypothetical protein